MSISFRYRGGRTEKQEQGGFERWYEQHRAKEKNGWRQTVKKGKMKTVDGGWTWLSWIVAEI